MGPGYIDKFKIGVTAAKWGGRALLGLAIAGDVVDVATAPPGQRVQRAISDGASLTGAIYGGEIGAEIGSAAGPVGTVVGDLDRGGHRQRSRREGSQLGRQLVLAGFPRRRAVMLPGAGVRRPGTGVSYSST